MGNEQGEPQCIEHIFRYLNRLNSGVNSIFLFPVGKIELTPFAHEPRTENIG